MFAWMQNVVILPQIYLTNFQVIFLVQIQLFGSVEVFVSFTFLFFSLLFSQKLDRKKRKIRFYFNLKLKL